MRTMLAAMIACVAALPSGAETITGTATVVDGDTLRIGRAHIRMAEIDAPEMKQGEPGRFAKLVLSRKIAGRAVSCEGMERDRYDRLVAVCHVGRVNLNRAMVSAGAAFAYWPFRDDQLHRLACPVDTMAECHRTSAAAMLAEDRARDAHRGIWGWDVLPANPWCARHPEGCRK